MKEANVSPVFLANPEVNNVNKTHIMRENNEDSILQTRYLNQGLISRHFFIETAK